MLTSGPLRVAGRVPAQRSHPDGTTSELVVGLDALLARAGAVDGLLRATHTPATARWLPLLTWMQHSTTTTPWCVLVYRGDLLVAAALLARNPGVRVLTLHSMGEPGLPSGLPATDVAAARALARALGMHLRASHLPWVLHLDMTEPDDPVLVELASELVVGSVRRNVTPRLVFRDGEPLSTYLSRNTRSALAKARNRTLRHGLETELRWTRDAAEIEAQVPELVELYQRRTAQLGQDVSLLADPAYQRYYCAMVRAFAREGVARLLTHRLDGELAAFALCLVSEGTLYVYANRMAPQWASLSPGLVANAEVVRTAHADPAIRCVDWGPGLQRYKLSGDVTLHPYLDVTLFSGNLVRHAWVSRQRAHRLRSAVGARVRALSR